MHLIEFALSKALGGAELVTRDGRDVIDWHYYSGIRGRPLRVVIAGNNQVTPLDAHGRYWGKNNKSPSDVLLRVNPKARPWNCDSDVPINAWFRRKDGIGGMHAVIAKCNYIVHLAEIGPISLTYLVEHWLYTIDGTTWKPCEVEE